MPTLVILPRIVSCLTLAGVLLGILFLMCAAIVVLLARSLVRPPRMTDGKAAWVLRRLSPGDLGMTFEEIAFDVRDAKTHAPLRITGWWIPGKQPSTRTAILLHGYADAKVGAIAWAPAWHHLGWNILAIDLRAHGESGGTYCTGGYFERDDVSQVIDQLRARRPSETQRLARFGASFGAAVAVATAATRDDVDAVVLDSPVPDFAIAAAVQMERLGAPGGVLRQLAVSLAQSMTGARYADVRLLDLLPTSRCAVLIVAPEHDVLLEDGMREKLKAALESRPAGAGPSVFWHVPGAGHLLALVADADEYVARLDRFLSIAEASSAPRPHSA